MLMSYERYVKENEVFALPAENEAEYPSVFELICLLPLSGKSVQLETPSSDDCII